MAPTDVKMASLDLGHRHIRPPAAHALPAARSSPSAGLGPPTGRCSSGARPPLKYCGPLPEMFVYSIIFHFSTLYIVCWGPHWPPPGPYGRSPLPDPCAHYRPAPPRPSCGRRGVRQRRAAVESGVGEEVAGVEAWKEGRTYLIRKLRPSELVGPLPSTTYTARSPQQHSSGATGIRRLSILESQSSRKNTVRLW